MDNAGKLLDASKVAKSTHGKALLLGGLILVLIAAGVGAFYWRNQTANDFEKQQASKITALQQTVAGLQMQLDKAKTAATPAPTPCTVKAPNAATIDNITASITSGNTAALEGYMAASVNVVVAASGVTGAITTAEAVSKISNFISSDTTTWDYNFSLSAATLNTYKNGSYGQYFPSTAVVGKASNKKVIAFSFDCNAKISTVFMAASDSLLQ